MKIGIIGSGNIGGALGQLWCRAGHEVLFSSRNPEGLEHLLDGCEGVASVGTPEDAMAFAPVLLEALPFAATLDLPADPLRDKLLVSASNLYRERDGDVELEGRSQSERLQDRLPGVRVVKAFNMMQATEMQRRINEPDVEPLAVYLASDDENARSTVAELVTDAGFAPVDAGRLHAGCLFESGAALYDKRWTREEAEVRLRSALST